MTEKKEWRWGIHGTSSNIRSASYDNTGLFLTFISGGTYRYDNVPERIVDEMFKAESIGHFIHVNIKGKYPSTKMPKETQGGLNV